MRASFFSSFSRPSFLCWFYVDFGSLWGHFGLPLAPFGPKLGPLGLTLGPFGHPFGSLWLTFGALGLTFAHPGARVSHFWALLTSFFTFLNIFDEIFTFLNIFDEILRKILLSENVHCKSDSIDQAHRIPTIFAQFSIKIQVRDKFCRILQGTAEYYCRILLRILQNLSRSILQYPAVSCSSILQ